MAKRKLRRTQVKADGEYNGHVAQGDQINGPINNSVVGGRGNTNQIVNIHEQHNYNGNIVWDTSGIKEIHHDLHEHSRNSVSDTSLERVMEILLQQIVPGAFHDSAERGDPPKCHENTRQAVLKKIMDWLQDQDNRHLFLWLFGPAGAGKTAIAGTVAVMAQQLKLLAATFFFSRSATGRNIKDFFIVTLAYQLARFIPEMTFYLRVALHTDPAIFYRSLSSQLQILIVKPLNSVVVNSEIKPTTAILIIVDGLDECNNSDNAHQYILKLLLECSTTCRYPIRFLVASRPEWQIRQPFSGGDLAATTIPLALDDDYRADDDIRTLFVSEFARIKKNHPAAEDLPRHWPPNSDITKLVEKASRQFIYASTVIKFVDCDHDNPVNRLKIILGISPVGDHTPFAQLDAIYTYILASGIPAANLEDTMTLLLIILLGKEHSSSTVASILGCPSARLKILLNGLNSLVGSSKGQLSMYHASFGEFLFAPLRAGRFHITPENAHERIAIHCIQSAGNPEARATCLGFGFEVVMLADHIMFHLAELSLTEKLRVLLLDIDLVECLGLSPIPKSKKHWLESFMDWLRNAAHQGSGKDDQTTTPTELELIYENRLLRYFMDKVDKYPAAIRPSLFVFLSLPNNNIPSNILSWILYGVWVYDSRRQVSDVSVHLSDSQLADLHLAFITPGKISKALISRIFLDAIRTGRCKLGGHDYANLAISMLPVASGLYWEDLDCYVACVEVLSRTVLPKAAKKQPLGKLIHGCWYYGEREPGCNWRLGSFSTAGRFELEVTERYHMATCVLAKAGFDYLKRFDIPIEVHQHDTASYQTCFLCSGPSCDECLAPSESFFRRHRCNHHRPYRPVSSTRPDGLHGLDCYCATRKHLREMSTSSTIIAKSETPLNKTTSKRSTADADNDESHLRVNDAGEIFDGETSS